MKMVENPGCFAFGDLLSSLGAPTESHTNGATVSGYPASNINDGLMHTAWRALPSTTPSVLRLRWSVTVPNNTSGYYGTGNLLGPGCVFVVGGLRLVQNSPPTTGTMTISSITAKIGSTVGSAELGTGTATGFSMTTLEPAVNLPMITFGRFGQSGYKADRVRGYRSFTGTLHVELAINISAASQAQLEISTAELKLGVFGGITADELRYSVRDDSNIQYSYSGMPYISRRTPVRMLGFRMRPLLANQVFGGPDTDYGTGATTTREVALVNAFRNTGLARTVCVIPSIDLTYGSVGVNDAATAAVYGLLTNVPSIQPAGQTEQGMEGVVYGFDGEVREVLRPS